MSDLGVIGKTCPCDHEKKVDVECDDILSVITITLMVIDPTGNKRSRNQGIGENLDAPRPSLQTQ